MYISISIPSRRELKAFAQIPEIHPPKLQRIDSHTSKTLMRAVKLTTIIIIVALLQVSAKPTAQQHISITVHSATLEKVFAEIEKQSGYTVFYNVEVLKAAGLVTLDIKDASIEDVMRLCLKGLSLEFTVQEKTIFVKKDTRKAAWGPASGPGNLIPSTLAGLTLSMSKLDETVVKGYYNTTNRLNTGDVTTVKGEDIERQPVTDPILASEGKVPGLYIQQASGVPGSYSIIRIEGQNSIFNGNDPLYIVDGVPYSPTSLTSPDIGGGIISGPSSNGINSRGSGMSPFNLLNPADIESVEVLKDADATAIYGSITSALQFQYKSGSGYYPS